MTAPLRDRLTRIFLEIANTFPVDATAEEWAQALTDALLASEEWRAREAVVWEEAQRIADDWPAECLEGDGANCCGGGLADEFGRRAALARLDAVRGKEPDDATDRLA